MLFPLALSQLWLQVVVTWGTLKTTNFLVLCPESLMKLVWGVPFLLELLQAPQVVLMSSQE
jgi:hypothetical protein